jgi:copper homeostasis protein
MIRPRTGLFQYSAAEERNMQADIVAVKEAGLAGVVLGAQNSSGALDTAMLERLLNCAHGLGCTMHRVIDVVPDPLQALETAIELGFERVLTSGAANKAVDGLPVLQQMRHLADGRIVVMPGSGVNADNIAAFIATGVSEVHASCAASVAHSDRWDQFAPAGGAMRTCETRVRTLVQAMVV